MNYCNRKNCKKAIQKIEHDSQFKPVCCFNIIGPTGPQGLPGPTGSNANSTACFCVDQMRNVIQQIITLYPNDNLIIAMESGNNVSGRPGSLLPTPQ